MKTRNHIICIRRALSVPGLMVARKAAMCLLMLLAPVFFVRAQVRDTSHVEIKFPIDQTTVLRGFSENAEALSHLDRMLETTAPGDIRVLVITSAASPEGPREANLRISYQRGEALRDYILERRPDLKNRIEIRSTGEAWDALRALDSSVPAGSDEAVLRALPTFRNIVNQHLPKLRYASIDMLPTIYAIPSWDTSYDLLAVNPDTLQIPEVEPCEIPVVDTVASYIYRPVLGVSTNLLYDVILTPNVSLELPLGMRWSVLAEYDFPWWVTSDNRRAWQILKWDLGARYWFGRRSPDYHDLLTGFFLGVDLGAGYYDIEPQHEGYQG